MKLLLLSITFISLFANQGVAQFCTPGSNFADSTYGVWPDIETNFPLVSQNVSYSTDINFKVPSTVTAELDATGQFVGTPIQDFEITGVNGLPTGLSYACNISSCQYLGGANGCANIYGTTSAATGIYPVTIDVDATVLVELLPGFPIPIVQSVSFDGYNIVIGTAGIVEQVIAPLIVYPNPTNSEISIEGITESMQVNEISIFNIEGKVVANRNETDVTNFKFDLSSIKSGIYFVDVSHASGIETIKFIKQ